MADGAEHAALVGAADALAGVLDDQQLCFRRAIRMIASMSHAQAPHVHGHDGPRARPDGALRRAGARW